jgi:hypothetical protein
MNEPYIPARFHIPGRRKFWECELDLKCSVQGKYKVQILHPRGTITKPFGDDFIPNVITNAGLDAAMSGTGLYTFVNQYFKAGTSATAVAVTDTALNAWWAGSNVKTGSGAGTTNDTVNGAATHTQSIDFAAAGSGVTLNEFGAGNSTSNTGTLYTHSLFPAAVTLNTGDVLRVAYTLTVSIPATVTAVPISLSAINGFNISGNMKVVGTFTNIFGLFAAGGTLTGGFDEYIRNSLASTNTVLCSAPTTFPTVNASISTTALGTSVSGSLATYTNGSFSRNQTFIWVPSNPSSTVSNVNGILLNSSSTSTGVYILLTSAQTKANTNTLTVITNCTMSRV